MRWNVIKYIEISAKSKDIHNVSVNAGKMGPEAIQSFATSIDAAAECVESSVWSPRYCWRSVWIDPYAKF